jgi:hypothetical protein
MEQTMNSQITQIAAQQHNDDLHRAAERARRAHPPEPTGRRGLFEILWRRDRRSRRARRYGELYRAASKS